jgi:hypothetical protein
MKPFRPLLTALLALMFWVQGMAMAAAPVDLPADAAQEAAESAAEMPCHGDAPDVAPCDCCDGDCPDMASCAIGHVFAAPPSATAPVAPTAQRAVAAGGWSLQTAVLALPVRPPIVLHA